MQDHLPLIVNNIISQITWLLFNLAIITWLHYWSQLYLRSKKHQFRHNQLMAKRLMQFANNFLQNKFCGFLRASFPLCISITVFIWWYNCLVKICTLTLYSSCQSWCVMKRDAWGRIRASVTRMHSWTHIMQWACQDFYADVIVNVWPWEE